MLLVHKLSRCKFLMFLFTFLMTFINQHYCYTYLLWRIVKLIYYLAVCLYTKILSNVFIWKSISWSSRNLVVSICWVVLLCDCISKYILLMPMLVYCLRKCSTQATFVFYNVDVKKYLFQYIWYLWLSFILWMLLLLQLPHSSWIYMFKSEIVCMCVRKREKERV